MKQLRFGMRASLVDVELEPLEGSDVSAAPIHTRASVADSFSPWRLCVLLLAAAAATVLTALWSVAHVPLPPSHESDGDAIETLGRSPPLSTAPESPPSPTSSSPPLPAPACYANATNEGPYGVAARAVQKLFQSGIVGRCAQGGEWCFDKHAVSDQMHPFIELPASISALVEPDSPDVFFGDTLVLGVR